MQRGQISQEWLTRLRALCLELPAAYEEAAWAGTRWMIGKRNFTHAVMIAHGWPPAYARAAGSPGPLAVVTFRVSLADGDASRFRRRPYFKPPWWPDIVGIGLDADTDWDRVSTHVIASYRLLAPKRLLPR